MISTGRTGRAVAVVSGGSQDGTVIRIATECDAEVPKRHMHDVLDEGDLLIDPRKFKLLSLEDQTLIMEALERGDLDEDEGDEDDSEEEKPYQPLRGPQRRVAKTYAEKSKYEYRVNDGRMVVLPSKETERVFVAGMSGSGKSCFTASYMLEYSDMFPDRRIILFSTHEDEKAYRAIEHTQAQYPRGHARAPAHGL
jgi:ABC-type glutathione transport system ATPase component